MTPHLPEEIDVLGAKPLGRPEAAIRHKTFRARMIRELPA